MSPLEVLAGSALGSYEPRAILPAMDTFKIRQISRTYWIEAVTPSGVERPVEAWPSEEAALARLEALRKPADVVVLPVAPEKGS